jgi:hypothetical protein
MYRTKPRAKPRNQTTADKDDMISRSHPSKDSIGSRSFTITLCEASAMNENSTSHVKMPSKNKARKDVSLADIECQTR